MLSEIFWAIGLSVALTIMFFISNWVHSKTDNFILSRKIAHFSAGFCILAFPFVFESVLFPIILPCLFLGLLYGAHKSELFHGFVMKARLAELNFAISSLICIAVAWWINPWLAIVPCMFLAFGDGVTGLVRWLHHRGQAGFKKYWCGTFAMLPICLGFAFFLNPFWIGLVGAVIATGVEKISGKGELIPFDDNLTVPLVSLAIMLPLYYFLGA